MLPKDNNSEFNLMDEPIKREEEEPAIIDIHALAEEIFRLLKRELSLENERCGR